jgi:tetratricopeptide (TPR) repeat protein
MSVVVAAELSGTAAGPSDPVRDIIKKRFPSVCLESHVQGWAYLEQFQRGVEEFERIPDPTAKDYRWLGVCYFQLMEDMNALEAFYRAVAGGEEAARINLAHLLPFLERGEEASDHLKSIRLDLLSPNDRVLHLRVLSMDEENNGNLREALRSAEEAWKRIQGMGEFAIFAPSILAQLGILHSRIGRAQRALWFLERGLQITEGLEQKKVRLRRVPVLTSLGRYLEAKAELDTLAKDDLPPNFDAEVLLLRGDIAWSLGATDEAARDYGCCIKRAAELQVTFEEFVSRLSLAALLQRGGEIQIATQHLSRAQTLVSDKSDRLAFRFREIGLLLESGLYTAEHAMKEYQALDEEFGRMGLLKEQGFVKLHKAALLHRQGSQRYLAVLDDLQSLCVTLQNQAFLAKEWLLLPELRRAIRRSHSNLLGEDNDILEVRTLGDERLTFAGEPVAIPLRRLVEVLAYFLEHKAVSLKRLLLDVFPDEKPRSAKSYFHQCRFQLKEHIPAVQIEFDAEAKLYRLKSEVDIVWDVAEVRAGRKSGDFGLFLPSSGTDWALTLDHGLDRYREPTVTAA